MASPTPSEENRALLREYRITTIPLRRYSQQKLKQQSPVKLEDQQTEVFQQDSPTVDNCAGNKQQLQQSQSQSQTQKRLTQHSKHKPSPSQKVTHHHHKHHHHRKHKHSAAHELKPEELSRMLELASGLSYLKLVSPAKMKSGGTNDNNHQNGNIDKNVTANDCEKPNPKTISSNSTHTNGNIKDNEMSKTNGINGTSNINSSTKDEIQRASDRISRYCVDLSIKCNNKNNICKPYIFEKVDYIKKFKETNIRKREIKKLKRKAKNKTRVIAPPNGMA